MDARHLANALGLSLIPLAVLQENTSRRNASDQLRCHPRIRGWRSSPAGVKPRYSTVTMTALLASSAARISRASSSLSPELAGVEAGAMKLYRFTRRENLPKIAKLGIVPSSPDLHTLI